LKIRLFNIVLPGSKGCTLIRKNLVPNFALPVATARSKYKANIAIDIVPKSGNHVSNQKK
jgi:hypothetical protein